MELFNPFVVPFGASFMFLWEIRPVAFNCPIRSGAVEQRLHFNNSTKHSGDTTSQSQHSGYAFANGFFSGKSRPAGSCARGSKRSHTASK